MTFCRVLSLAAVLAVTATYPAYAQFGGMPGMRGAGRLAAQGATGHQSCESGHVDARHDERPGRE